MIEVDGTNYEFICDVATFPPADNGHQEPQTETPSHHDKLPRKRHRIAMPVVLRGVIGAEEIWEDMYTAKSTKWNSAITQELYKLLAARIGARYTEAYTWKKCRKTDADSCTARCNLHSRGKIDSNQVQEWIRNRFKQDEFKEWLHRLDDQMSYQNCKAS